MTGSGEIRSASRLLAALAVPILFGVYPITIVLAFNPDTSWWIVLRATTVVVAGTSLLFWALGRVWPSFRGRGILLATWYLLLSWYAFVLLALRMAGPRLETTYLPAGLIYAALSGVIAVLIARPWRPVARGLATAGFIGLVLIGVNVPSIVRNNATDPSWWKATADSMVVAPAHTTPAGPPRDIYYIVLDGFGRADTLKRLYGVDLGPTIEHLRGEGFYIPDQARSNYAQTSLSLSSLLNFSYLDRLGSDVGTSSGDRRPTEYVIQHNALMALAQSDGYRVEAIGADDMVTQRIDQADVCICGRYGLDGFEQAVVGLTPWAAFSDRWTYSAHRAKIRDAFSAIERAPAAAGPRLVFAHILVPHPPFVFDADGSARTQSVFTLNDGNQFLGTPAQYVEGYRAQVQFAARRVVEVIDELLSRPGPPPVIVVHGDHGPGSRLQWEHPETSDLSERMNIFAAYYFPAGQSRLYPTMTPVTGTRALADDYLGASLTPLPDRTMFSTWSHPYAFIVVPPESSPSAARGGGE